MKELKNAIAKTVEITLRMDDFVEDVLKPLYGEEGKNVVGYDVKMSLSYVKKPGKRKENIRCCDLFKSLAAFLDAEKVYACYAECGTYEHGDVMVILALDRKPA